MQNILLGYTMEKIMQSLETYFKIKMPSPINYPASFMYYLNIYRMYKKNEKKGLTNPPL